jgi:hypothetical protein
LPRRLNRHAERPSTSFCRPGSVSGAWMPPAGGRGGHLCSAD